MTLRLSTVPILFLLLALFAVKDLWTGGPKELSRVREDAVSLNCDAGKVLVLRVEPDGKSAWIIFPDREFRLDRVEGTGDARYSNGRTTLEVKGGQYSLEEGGTATLANCVKPQA